MKDRRIIPRIGVVALLLSILCLVVVAADPPDSEVNPVSGYIESVYSAWENTDFNISHVTDPGDEQPIEVVIVSGHPSDDLGARIEISSAGDTWVVWWRDAATDQVLIRKRTYSDDSWSSERLVSDSGESSRNPEIVHDGSDAWVAYEFDDAGGTSVAANVINDEPDPIPDHTVVGTTSYSGDVDVLIQAESGNIWVSWVDSTSDVGWSEYDYSTASWGAPQYESYANDDVEAARARIRTTVLGN